MTLAGWIVILVIVGCLLVLILTTISPDIVFLGGLTVVIVAQAIKPAEALVGFSNQGMLTVAALYIVAAGLKETGAIQFVVNKLIGRSKNIRRAQMRIMAPVMTFSAFINNTPVVASFMPALQEWARKNRIPASKLLIPLSYAAMLGGTCTLIGTSTNLVVNGLLMGSGYPSLSLFEQSLVGLPVAVAGFIYLSVFGRKLLPIRGSGFDNFRDPKEYTIEMIVDTEGPLVGKTIEDAGLRNLPGLFLVEINRKEQIIVAVEPDETLEAKDRLIFAGVIASIVDLQKIKGISPATDQVFRLESEKRERLLAEAVVSLTNPVHGKTIREGRFRNIYDAVVLAVSRNGERIKEKVGDIKLKEGDTLLLEANSGFVEQYRNSKDFYLISRIANSSQPKYEKATTAWVVLAAMILGVASGYVTMFQASWVAAGGMLITGCCNTNEAMDSIDWTVLLVIAATLGLGNAMQLTGAAQIIAAYLLSFAQSSPFLALAGTYLFTVTLTEIITNTAAAALIFPIAISIASVMDVSLMPFVIVVMMAASAAFATPFGYQTNLMVYGPGGYKFTDFTKIGLPLNLIIAIITLILVPIFWPF